MFGDGTGALGTDITVTGTPKVPVPPVTQPVEAATPAGTPVTPAVPKKKHIWQDILGALGDGLLAQGGGKPIYGDFREKREIGTAMEGFEKDPMGTIKQITKLNPVLGERLLNNYQENELRKDGQAYTEMRAKRDDDLKRQEYEDKTFDVAFTMLGAPGIAKTYKQTRAQILGYLDKRGIDPEKAGLPEDYDEVAIKNLYGTTKRAMDMEKANSLEAYRAGVLDVRRDRLAQTGSAVQSQNAYREVQAGNIATDNTLDAEKAVEQARHNRKMEDRPTGKKPRAVPALPGDAPTPTPRTSTSAPPKGYKNKYGKEYTGVGDPNDIKNWK